MTVETIVAIATPPGRGGVGIVRISGPSAYEVAQTITQKTVLQPRKAYFAHFYDLNHEVIDQGLVLYFNAPHSFTGEDVVELHAHGSPLVLDELIQLAIQLGARVAKPGEFSQRAFLNDKLDLAQAEAIADLIEASSHTAARLALRSLQGEFSKTIQALTEDLIQLRLYVEAAIDFPDEEVDFLSDGHIASHLHQLIQDVRHIRSQATQGAILREGLTIVIAGKPNAGKSTLMNLLAKRDVAIVTDVAGTTRDVMREHVLLDDIPVCLIDTAGLRKSDDPIEQEGIKRAWQEVKKADCVLFLIDASRSDSVCDLESELISALPPHIPIVSVYNKIDICTPPINQDKEAIYLSAKSGEGIEKLKQKIKDWVGYHPSEAQFLARRRHLEALDTALAYLIAGENQLHAHRAGELLADDLRLSQQALSEITGEFSSDDLLGRIFSSFCIGK